ncbi:cytochrome c5 family protein [Halioxenophilus sp. WMMB6]|uniref:c-type cytochrome n=1 Tax=Halioxenophilus sp. WMMB6 TaxID=3073815 RepID=UPI00295ED988|nr:cytochrome c5 family protein [Halioxenophilus sp. WMMB6]
MILISRVLKKLNVKGAAGLVAILALMTSSFVVAENLNDAIEERIKPVSKVCMSGDDCAAAPVAAAPAEPRTGEELVNTKCGTCHKMGVSGAPRIGNAGEWGPRAAQGLDTLFDHALNGFNAMPPKGLCADCSDDELKSAISYMVDHSK